MSSKEIKNQILSVKKIQKITDVMQKVAASKMRRAQQRMVKTMPYTKKICEVMHHVAASTSEYNNTYLHLNEKITGVGYIVVTTDRGLCGGLNVNLCKTAWEHAQQFYKQKFMVDWCLLGEKASSFFQAAPANIVAHITNLGEEPKVADLVGSIKIMLDAYQAKNLGRLFIINNEFVTTMLQRPKITQILPIPKSHYKISQYNWDYVYEPSPQILLDALIVRYIEAQLYQAVVDNIACEQVARMLSMKNATNNAKDLITDLQLVYNKIRQATITQEIAEIMGGVAAI